MRSQRWVSTASIAVRRTIAPAPNRLAIFTEDFDRIGLGCEFSIDTRNEDQIKGTESEERSGVLETRGDDGSPSRKLARVEDRRTGDSLATGDERK